MGQYDTEIVSSDLLPKVGSRWCEYEKKALEIRRLVGARSQDRFDPYQLANILKFKIIRFSQVDGLPDHVRQQIITNNQWSGAAIEIPHDGTKLIIINDLHSHRRQRATLMEEICHLILGHQPSKLNYADNSHGSPVVSTLGRTYHHQIEEEAYAIGAATLVPFKPLRDFLQSGLDVKSIADRFDVSVQLVNYRIRVAGLQRESFSG